MSAIVVCEQWGSLLFWFPTGMRLILEPKANAVLDRIEEILEDESINPFLYEPMQSRILSGEEEGAFAWIAANYLNNYFDNPGFL